MSLHSAVLEYLRPGTETIFLECDGRCMHKVVATKLYKYSACVCRVVSVLLYYILLSCKCNLFTFITKRTLGEHLFSNTLWTFEKSRICYVKFYIVSTVQCASVYWLGFARSAMCVWASKNFKPQTLFMTSDAQFLEVPHI